MVYSGKIGTLMGVTMQLNSFSAASTIEEKITGCQPVK
jgi:hypothetical protein